MSQQFFDKDGKPIDDEIILPDGKSIRVNMLMMDADALRSVSANLTDSQKVALADALNAQQPPTAMHRPGSLPLTDADRAAREQALDARDKRLVDAWKSPPAADATSTQKPAPTTPQMSAADQRDAWLRDAWRAS